MAQGQYQKIPQKQTQEKQKYKKIKSAYTVQV